MSGEERRKNIVSMLEGRAEYLNASKMAQALGVSRQIIVSDIALLRAQGVNIVSAPRGYLLSRLEEPGYTEIIVCRHDKLGIREEFFSVVDNGGIVLDVSIDHPIYGPILAPLNIRSRFDANLFIERISKEYARPLSALTGGLHTHRVHCKNEQDFTRIQNDLRKNGILEEDFLEDI